MWLEEGRGGVGGVVALTARGAIMSQMEIMMGLNDVS